MRLLLNSLLGVALLGGGMASAAVTVRVRNAADGAATVNVAPNSVVNAAIIVESDETVTGAQVDLVASGGTGALSVVGANSAYNAPTWDNADTALPMIDGAIGAGKGPHGTGIVTPGILAAPGSQMSVVQIQVPSGASGTFLVNVANQLAFPDYTGGAAPDIAATADTDLTINVQATCVRTIAARSCSTRVPGMRRRAPTAQTVRSPVTRSARRAAMTPALPLTRSRCCPAGRRQWPITARIPRASTGS